ncbi:MAG: sugar transporter [Pseudomonadota bacterium]
MYYLYTVAADQFSSRVSFSIRSEEFQNPLDALGTLGQISTGTSSDASILNEYIRSQKLIEDISEDLDLGTLYSKPEYDPVFAFDPNKPIEDLIRYWHWMTYVTYDAGSGLIDVEAFAFTPEDAHQIATAIMEASSDLVDELSNIAREDTTRHAAYELERARERLTEARVALGALRDREQLIDPRADLEARMGVLTALQQQLAEATIEYDLMVGSTRAGDSRLDTINRRIDAIKNRIEQERNKIGQTSADPDTRAFASVVGSYESLLADREFAEQSYIAAAASYDTALAEARRKSRYLAAHVPPTMAQSAQYPNRLLMSLGVFGALLLVWMILVLTAYAMMDRR